MDGILLGKEDLAEIIEGELGEHATPEIIQQVLKTIMEGEGETIAYSDFKVKMATVMDNLA